MACQEMGELCLEGKEEPASEEMKPEVVHQEVPREHASVVPVGGLRKQRRGRKEAAGRHEEPKKLNRGICGSREKLAAACRRVSCRATVAWRKRNMLRKPWTQRICGLRKEVTAAGMKIGHCAGHRSKRQNKDDAERETWKGREQNGRWRGPEWNNDIRNRGLRQQLQGRNTVMLQVESTGNLDTTFRKTTRLGIIKRLAGFPVALQRNKKWTLWRGRPPLKRKKQH
jgi:hypothetical protein